MHYGVTHSASLHTMGNTGCGLRRHGGSGIWKASWQSGDSNYETWPWVMMTGWGSSDPQGSLLPPSWGRGRTAPNSSSSEARCLQRKVLEPLAGLDACPGGASRLVGSRTPHVTRGCVPRPSWAGTKQPPDCIGQTLGSTWRGGASRGYESLGNETTTARPVFQPWGWRKGSGSIPEWILTENGKSRLVRDLPPAWGPLRHRHHTSLRQHYTTSTEATTSTFGNRVYWWSKWVGGLSPVLPRRQGSSPHSRQAGVTRRQFNSGRPGSLYSIRWIRINSSSSSSSRGASAQQRCTQCVTRLGNPLWDCRQIFSFFRSFLARTYRYSRSYPAQPRTSVFSKPEQN